MLWIHPPPAVLSVKAKDGRSASKPSGVMTNKESRKIQFAGWTKRRYKEIRRKLDKRIEREYKIRLGRQV